MTPGAPHYFAYAKNATKRFAYPQRVQRLVINDYAARRGLTVTLFFAELPRLVTPQLQRSDAENENEPPAPGQSAIRSWIR